MLFVDDLAAFAAGANFFTVFETLDFNAGRCHALAAHQHHVCQVDWRLNVDNTPLLVLCRRPGMPLYHVEILDNDPVLFPMYLQDFADLTFVLSGNHFYLVVFFDFSYARFHQRILHEAVLNRSNL